MATTQTSKAPIVVVRNSTLADLHALSLEYQKGVETDAMHVAFRLTLPTLLEELIARRNVSADACELNELNSTNIYEISNPAARH